ncbi:MULTISPECIES: ABC transporter permease [Brevibacterium]|uniref:Transport permease protein n=2 Tax=Brevibacterium TaxID=1696 RepID=A0A1H1LQF4_BRESA|nr:ABC transporter permease [Brevibacterium sandarakinum]SDR76570.1 ABC-2 type transport system permease protein [Brevibacterium sandarakinum]
MSTTQTTQAARRAPIGTVSTDTSQLPARPGLVESWNQTMGFAARALKRMRREPEQFSDVAIQPILFTVMFGFIFGGAISGDIANYLPLMVPGILAMTCLTASMDTGVQLREDMDTGIFDRFRTLPVARIAPLAGPMVADLVRYAIAASLTFLTGIAMGYRPEGGALGVIAAIILVVVTGWSLSWAFAYIGTVVRSAQGAQGISMMILFPLTFLSNAFVPVESLPNWLQWFVTINPISHVVSGVRDLANTGAVTAEVGWALVGCAVVIAIFAPLALRSYQRR